jgi:hypothetical protein
MKVSLNELRAMTPHERNAVLDKMAYPARADRPFKNPVWLARFSRALHSITLSRRAAR